MDITPDLFQRLRRDLYPVLKQFKDVLTIPKQEVLTQMRAQFWELQREIFQKLHQIEINIEMQIADLISKSDDQLELLMIAEKVMSQIELTEVESLRIPELTKMTTTGVNESLGIWTSWKTENMQLISDEIGETKVLSKPLLRYRIGQLKVLINQEIKPFNDNTSRGLTFYQDEETIEERSPSRSVQSSESLAIDYDQPIHTIKGHSQPVFACLQLSNSSIVTSSFDGSVRIWNPTTYKLEFSSPPLKTPYNDVVEITNNNMKDTLMIAASNDDQTIKVLVKQGTQNWTVYKELPKVKEGTPFHLAYDHENNVLLFNHQRNGHTIQIYDMNTFKISETYHYKFKQTQPGTSIILLRDKRFLTGDIEGNIYKWQYTNSQYLLKYRAHQNSINFMTLMKDFRVATCCQDGMIKLWAGSMLGGQPLQVFEHIYPIWSLMATNRYLMSGDVEGNISFHCPDSLMIRKSMKAHQNGVFMIRPYFQRTSGFISSGEDMQVKIWKC